jgi:ferredoxin
MARRLRVVVDHDLCVGNGTCLTIAPAVFEHNANRQSEAKHPDGAPEAAILDAARNCPVAAIGVEVEGTGERLFP